SWNPTLQTLAPVADLWVNDVGRLECCPVLPGMDAAPVSPQAVTDRTGYVAVRLNTELTEAELVGFIPSLAAEWVEGEAIPLTEWRSLAALPEYLASLESIDSAAQVAASGEIKTPSSAQQPESTGAIAQLSGWLNDAVDNGWQALEVVMEQIQQRSTQELAYGFRQPVSSHRRPSSEVVKRGKFLMLGDQSSDELLFLVGVKPSEAGSEMNITVEVYPFETQSYLPQTIQLAVMDATGKAVLQAEGGNSEGLEFHFSGEPGERFSVRVSIEGHQFIEQFQV
ncbi:MAG: DUF1822 family protein, partial [Cyanobacteria bacterium P01_A01_bin.135]